MKATLLRTYSREETSDLPVVKGTIVDVVNYDFQPAVYLYHNGMIFGANAKEGKDFEINTIVVGDGSKLA